MLLFLCKRSVSAVAGHGIVGRGSPGAAATTMAEIGSLPSVPPLILAAIPGGGRPQSCGSGTSCKVRDGVREL